MQLLHPLIKLLNLGLSPVVLISWIDVYIDLIRDVDGWAGSGTIEGGNAVVEHDTEENNDPTPLN